MCSWYWDRWALVGLLLLAWALRLPPALQNRFHSDEALYGYWGLLIANGWDPWLASVPVYKPPLLPYLVAGAQALFGNAEFTVRLPGLAAGLLTIPLTAALAQALYRDRWVALVAAVGLALSPFAVLFSATAFTDLPMLAFGVGACVAAARGRPGWAGVLVGLSFASKQMGLVWLPLALGVVLTRVSHSRSWKSVGLQVGRLLLAFLPVAGLVFGWDAVRVAQGAQSFWRLGVSGYGGLRFIWSQELWPRLGAWVGVARYLFASPVVDVLLLVGLVALVRRALTDRRYTRESLVDLALVSFPLVYFLLHWLWAFPVWDRYLLPLLPILAVLLGRVLTVFANYLQRKLVSRLLPLATYHLPLAACLLCLLLAVALALPAYNAAHSRYPVGGDHGIYDGIDQVAAFLRGQPEGTVVYQHWLGWQYAYRLFYSSVYAAYWHTPAWLAQDVQAFGTVGRRYIVFPSWESSARAERALADVGYGLMPMLATTRRDGTRSFTVYRIQSLSNE